MRLQSAAALKMSIRNVYAVYAENKFRWLFSQNQIMKRYVAHEYLGLVQGPRTQGAINPKHPLENCSALHGLAASPDLPRILILECILIIYSSFPCN